LNKQDDTKKEATKTETHTQTRFSFLNLNTLLSIVIIIAVGFTAYIGWQQITQQQSLIDAQQQQLAQIHQQQTQANEQVQKQLQQNTLAQNQEFITLKKTIQVFLKQNRHSRRDWLITEAEYLVKLANYRLILAHDVPTSISALRAADERLREVGNPRFIPLRQAIAFDIQQLKSVTRVDMVGLSLKLNAIQKQLEALPLKTPTPETIQQKNQHPTQLSQIDSWKQLPMAIWQDLLKLFRIQTHNEQIQPLLSPEHRFFLVQNLKLQLEQARLALINNQPIIYKDRIRQAQQWIKQYFNSQYPLTQSMNKSLTQLAQVKINVALPDISNSLTQLQLLHTRTQKSIPKKSGRKSGRKSKLKRKHSKVNKKIRKNHLKTKVKPLKKPSVSSKSLPKKNLEPSKVITDKPTTIKTVTQPDNKPSTLKEKYNTTTQL